MKIFVLLTIFVAQFTFASSFDGVPMRCLRKANNMMKKFEDMPMVAVCRDRQKTNKEHYTFCNGRSCSGFTLDSNSKCKTSDRWNGQDDQDVIDQDEWKANCLVQEDFEVVIQ